MLGVLRRHREFRRLWLAQVVSRAGDWLNRVAILTVIGRLSGPQAAAGMGALFGVELAIRMMPTALFGPLAGPIADRVPRKLLMVGADLTRCLIVLGFLFVERPEHLPWLYGLLILQMSLSIFFEAARTASLPNTVDAEDLHEAYALSAATWSAMLTFGAMAGGLLVALIGVKGVFIADSLTYLISALILMRLKLPPMPVQPEAFRWADLILFRDLRRGLDHVRSLHLTPVLMAKAFWGPAGGFLVLISVAAAVRFSTGGANSSAPTEPGLAANAGWATGMLFSARGLGTGIGPILARRFLGSTDRALKQQIAAGFVIATAGYAFFAVCEQLAWAMFWVAAAHLGGSALWVASTTLWQKHVEDAYRGRVFALEFLGWTLSFAAGSLITGWLYDRIEDVRLTTWAVCGTVLLTGAAWVLWARRTGDRAESPQESFEDGAGTMVP